MSEQLNKDYISNDGAFYLLGIMTGFALVKYAYSSRCGTRSLEETLDPEEEEVLRQQKAAREKMFQLLEETIQVSIMFLSNPSHFRRESLTFCPFLAAFQRNQVTETIDTRWRY